MMDAGHDPIGSGCNERTVAPLDRLDRQLAFLLATDRLKQILRNNRLLDGSRNENSAEHSWHLTLMALTLAEHAPLRTDAARVAELLIVHDIVEIEAGDHWVTDDNASEVAAKEAAAAESLFGLLPPDQRRSEEHTSELQSIMRISYAVYCIKKQKTNKRTQ